MGCRVTHYFTLSFEQVKTVVVVVAAAVIVAAAAAAEAKVTVLVEVAAV